MRILRALSDWWRRLTRGGKRAKTRAEQPGAEGARTNEDAARPPAGERPVVDRAEMGEAAVRPIGNGVRPAGENTAEATPGPATGAAVNASRRPPGREDDLTVIRGIGEATQRLLYAAGIQSYADLARATPREIYVALNGSRRGVKVEQWIAQAHRLSEIAGPTAR